MLAEPQLSMTTDAKICSMVMVVVAVMEVVTGQPPNDPGDQGQPPNDPGDQGLLQADPGGTMAAGLVLEQDLNQTRTVVSDLCHKSNSQMNKSINHRIHCCSSKAIANKMQIMNLEPGNPGIPFRNSNGPCTCT